MVLVISESRNAWDNNHFVFYPDCRCNARATLRAGQKTFVLLIFRRHEFFADQARAQRYARTQHPDPIKDLKFNCALAASNMEHLTHPWNAPTLRVAVQVNGYEAVCLRPTLTGFISSYLQKSF